MWHNGEQLFHCFWINNGCVDQNIRMIAMKNLAYLMHIRYAAATFWQIIHSQKTHHNFPENSTSDLTHWGRVTHKCLCKPTIIVSDNGLSPGRRQAIIWTSAGILLNGPLATNVREILIGIHTFLFKKMHSKILSAKWCPFCLGLNELSSTSSVGVAVCGVSRRLGF